MAISNGGDSFEFEYGTYASETVLFKHFQKVGPISITNSKIHFKNVFKLLSSITVAK